MVNLAMINLFLCVNYKMNRHNLLLAWHTVYEYGGGVGRIAS